MAVFGRDILNDFNQAKKKEWIITNGIGGYASSTVIGCNTRRYHGLLVSALNPPAGRTVLVSKFEESVHKGREYYFLSTNKYPQTISPQGYIHALRFSSYPFPQTTFCLENIFIEKEIFMVQGENTTVITYNVISHEEMITFSISPLVVCRDFHWLMRETLNFFGNVTQKGDQISMKPFENMPEIYIRVDGMEFSKFGVWYKNMEYEMEQERGLNYQEDLFNPGRYTAYIKGEKTITVILSDHDVSGYDVKELRERELKRQGELLWQAKSKDNIERDLILSADKFIVRKKDNLKSILAGYHWFSDWGRDAMISLPGLLLATRRYGEAKKVFTAFAESMKDGLLPNLFSDFEGKPVDYNTIDASLWFIYAGYLYYKATNDEEFTYEKLLPWFEDIYANYMKGTMYDIKVDDDGLIRGGDETTQLTWMDVKINGVVVTKRHGKPVEVNALWYNVLRILEELTKDSKKKSQYSELSKKVKNSFIDKFWNSGAGCLYDVVFPDDQKDASVRPNQIFAVSLKFSVLSKEKETAVFKKVLAELYTSFGLRSLSKYNESYKGECRGNQIARDRAYHQGTVWSWLIGAFVDAFLKVNGNGADQIKELALLLQPLYDHLNDNGIGGVSEIFDGNEPHEARGSILQAWSVAELLRIKKELGI